MTIRNIVAGRGIAGHIKALGGIGVLRTTGVAGSGGAPGDVTGVITAPHLIASDGGLIDIAGSLTGTADLPQAGTITLSDGLPSNTTIRIGKTYQGPNPGSDWSTRIKIAPTESNPLLAGQIIINASGTGDETSWARMIQISDGIFLGPANGSGPFYTHTSASLGGGAIGVVPFRRHAVDCSPSDHTTVPHVFQSQLNHHVNVINDVEYPVDQVPIDIVHYGPVSSGGSTPMRIWHQISPTVFVDVTSRFTMEVNPGEAAAPSRTVRVKGNADTFFPAGLYFIEPVTSGTNALYCNLGPTNHPPVYRADANSNGVADDAYSFIVDWDCNGNLTEDWEDIQEHEEWDTDGDGWIDGCNRLGGCAADFYFDGWVNGDDFDLFTELFGVGSILADYNGDDFVNGDDFDQFSVAYQAGC